MSRHSKKQLIPPSVLFFSGLLIFFCMILMLALAMGTGLPIAPANKPQESVPYAAPVPEPAVFILNAADESWRVVLDFEENRTIIIPKSNTLFEPADKHLTLDNTAFAGIIDRAGGMEFVLPFLCDGFDNLKRRYTGSQIIKLLNTAEATPEELGLFKTELICNLIEKISEKGFSKSDFSYIINHGDSNLTYKDYYDVSEFLNEAFSKCECYS